MAKKRTTHRHRHPHHRPSTLPHFLQLAPPVMEDLISHFSLSPVQAAAIVGNLGAESTDFTAHHEVGQAENRGGYGWAQWTGHRRTAFFAWADSNGFPRESAEASYSFLVHELETTHGNVVHALKRQTELRGATHRFMRLYENPGVPHEPTRQLRATQALKAYNESAFAHKAATH
jgi:hypothetical protein